MEILTGYIGASRALIFDSLTPRGDVLSWSTFAFECFKRHRSLADQQGDEASTMGSPDVRKLAFHLAQFEVAIRRQRRN